MYCTLRRADDHDIQPVPRVSQKGEFPDADASGDDLYDGFQRVDGYESKSVHRDTGFNTGL